MKKFLVLLVMFLFIFTIASCGKEDDKGNGGGASGGGSGGGTPTDVDMALDAKFKGLCEGKSIYLTTCGQSDMDTVQLLMENSDPDGEHLGFSPDDRPTGKPQDVTTDPTIVFNDEGCPKDAVIFLVTGTSQKGLGQAKVDKASELKRAKDFADLAKKGAITLIVLHVGGEARRGDLSDDIIAAAIEGASLVLIVDSGNADGFFTQKCGTTPLYRYSKIAKMTSAFITLFNF